MWVRLSAHPVAFSAILPRVASSRRAEEQSTKSKSDVGCGSLSTRLRSINTYLFLVPRPNRTGSRLVTTNNHQDSLPGNMERTIFARISPLLFAALHFCLMPYACKGAFLLEHESPSVRELSELPMRPSFSPLVSMRHRNLETAEMVGLRDCKTIDKCEMCTFSDQKSIPACKETGRKQKMECIAFDRDGKRHRYSQLANNYENFVSPCSLIDKKTTADFYSCKYTDADNQFAMVS